MAKAGEKSQEDFEKEVHMNDHSGDEGVFFSDVDDMSQHSASDSEVSGVFKSCTSVDNPTTAVKDCRICHLSLEGNTLESGIPIDLGCSCKNDFAAAHKQCAETWFKIKGNNICEICGSMAKNVVCATASPRYTKSWWRHLIDAEMSYLFSDWLQTGDKRLLFLFFVFFCFFIIGEYVDYKRATNPSIAQQQEESAS